MRKNYTELSGFCQLKLTDSGGFAESGNGWFSRLNRKPIAAFLLLLTVFFGGGLAPVFAQTTITVGTGTASTNSGPINRYYNHSAGEQIYLGSEIGSAGVITSFALNKLGGTNNGVIENVTIYMKSTTTAVVGTSTSTDGYTQVYSGNFPNNTATGWQTVTLTTPFIYASTDLNLAVLIVRGRQEYISTNESPKYAYTSTSPDYRAGFYQNDSSVWSSSLTRSYNRPNIQLSLTALPAACDAASAPTALALSGVTSTAVTGAITAPATAPAGYIVVRSTAATLTAEPSPNVQYTAGTALGNGVVVANTNTTAFTDSTLSPNTHYYYFVYAYNYDSTFTCLGPAYSATSATADTTSCSTFPTTIGVSNITATTATLNWTSIAGVGGAAASYAIGVYTDAEYTNAVGNYTTGNTSYNLTGLTNGNTYYFRIQGSTAGTCSDPTYATGSFTAQSSYTPIDVTGFNFDVIANGTGMPGTTTNNAVDGGDYAYMALDYRPSATAAVTTIGLPLNRTLQSPTNTGIKYFLQNYTGNNSLRLADINTSGTLTLVQPLKLSNIYLAITSGNSDANISVKINFADGTDETVSNITVLDWYATANTASPALISGIGRVSRNGNGNPETGASKIFQITVPVSAANQAKNVTSITVTNTTSNATPLLRIPNIFAVAGQVVGSCPVMATVTASPASATSLNVNWTLSSAGDGAAPTYTLEVYSDEAMTTPVTGSPFTGLTATSQLVSSLTFGNTYYFRVRANNSECTSAYVTGSRVIEYCVPTSTTPTTYSLTNFTTTGGYDNIANNTTTASSYNNFSNLVVSKAAGSSFDYSIVRNSAYAGITVWVDWNNDLDFDDANEQIANYPGAFGNPTTVTGSIAIPAGTPLGNYRIRLRSGSGTLTPCGQLTNGETEDYTLTVAVQPADCAVPATPVVTLSNVTASNIDVAVTPLETVPAGYILVRSTSATLSSEPVSGTRYPAGAEFGGGTVIASDVTIANISNYLSANTHYYYFVYAYNDGGSVCFGPMYSEAGTADATTCAIATVAATASNIGTTSAVLNWSSVTGIGGSEATYTIEVATDDTFTTPLFTYTSNTNSFEATDLTMATNYYYRVKAVTTADATCYSDAWSAASAFRTYSIYTPLEVTGFNADVIANGTGIANVSTTDAVDAVSNAYIARDYKNTANGAVTSVGLPVNRTLSSQQVPGLNFLFADYSENNSLRLPAQNQAGTLTLTKPVKLKNIYLALTSGSGSSTISSVINFTDGTSQAAVNSTLIDWYNGGTADQPALIDNIGRANRMNTTGNVETGNSKVFYVTVPVTSENLAKTVESVTITKTSTGATEPVPNIFAVSGELVDECPVLNSAFVFGNATGGSVTFGLQAGSAPADSYAIAVYTDENLTNEVPNSPFTTATTTLTLTDLNPSTTYYYSATAVNSVCTSSPVLGLFLTTCDTPDTPTAAAQSVCVDATIADLSAEGAEGNTILWYATETATEPLAETTEVAAGTYYVSQKSGDCESTKTAVAVTINNIAAPQTEALTFCGEATAEALTATGAEGAEFTWYANEGGEPLAETADLVTGTYYVTQTINGCTSAVATVEVTINEIPAAPAAEAQQFCSGATAEELEAAAAEGATLTWYATEGGEPVEATDVLASGTYYVTQTSANGCVSEATPVIVTVNTVDAPEALETQDFVEGETVADLDVTLAEGATAAWFVLTEGEYVAIEPTTALENGVTYYVNQTVGDCTSDYTAITANLTASTGQFSVKTIAVYPNPASEVVNVKANESITSLVVNNLLGQTVMQQTVMQQNVNGAEVQLNISSLAEGTYILQVNAGSKSASVKIVKK